MGGCAVEAEMERHYLQGVEASMTAHANDIESRGSTRQTEVHQDIR